MPQGFIGVQKISVWGRGIIFADSNSIGTTFIKFTFKNNYTSSIII